MGTRPDSTAAQSLPVTCLYASVCVDVSHGDVDRLFHYAIPPEFSEISVGKRVRVPFGRGNGLKLGCVTEISELPPEISPEKIKPIHSVCDNFPVLTHETLALAFWMREKYYTTLAACVRCITPSAKSDGRFPGTRKAAKTSSDKQQQLKKTPDIILTNEQSRAVEQIKKIISEGGMPPLLLHGVTGSGKTEVYLRAIQHVLSKGRQAIVLVPEIALAPQIVSLFTARFGAAVAVTHSRLTRGERFHIWKSAMDNQIQLIIGPRSAIFTPFQNLGLIVIDEEHEHTYHSENSPKYDAREIAIKRAALNNAAVVLGSATPGLESYFKTTEDFRHAPHSDKSGARYQLSKLTHRVNKTSAEIHIVDMRKEMSRGNTGIFSVAFRDALGETLEAKRQAILFLNRRGHSSFVSCRWCGNVMSCDDCRVNYTYHADKERLLCHYCGRRAVVPKKCPACGSEHVRLFGVGTQKLEEEIGEIFPGIKTLRMDMDTTRGKFGHAKILDSFRRNEAQVLIGTQMVAKGLDFPNVTMVGVVAADMSLFTGDFRAGEYTFQLLTQVAGRAGRGIARGCDGDNGRVFIQTYNPEHYAILLAEKGDYDKFYAHEMSLRHAMVYPPYSHVFSVMFTGPNERDVIAALQKLAAIMDYCNLRDGKNRFEQIGFSPAFVSMIKKQFRWKLLVKCTDESPLVAFVLYCIKKLKENDPLKNLTIHLTLNPTVME
ncbi:MAG: primosomal protein N' [Defluviitaleaceae bacterium]|nr:primosomal protein N' [Defluviitaleaceae bacterium]